MQQSKSCAQRAISRRKFLQVMGASAAGLLAAGCRPQEIAESPQPAATAPPTHSATVAPTDTATVPPTTTATVSPTPSATARPTAAATVPPARPTPVPPTRTVAAQHFQVAIAQAESYDRLLIRRQVQALLDGLGGVKDVLGSGARVAIKVNLTGGTYFEPPPGVSATESYMTHPEVVRALGELLHDAGARKLFIVESLFSPDSFRLFGYEGIAQALNATLVDLNSPQPYSSFAPVPVGKGWFIYENLTLNPLLQEVDAFISVGKMKCHYNAGVTLSMKNLVGLVPVQNYRLDQEDWWRSSLHGRDDETPSRLPRVIVDINRARPIHLALLDGIKTAEGGEAPRGSFNPVQPGVLIAGKNPVATDAVAAAVMGFDPTVEPPAAPFLRGDNYLNIARALGMGTNRLNEIKIVGARIEDVRYPFRPGERM